MLVGVRAVVAGGVAGRAASPGGSSCSARACSGTTAGSCASPRSGSASPPRPRGCCARSAPACSAASATRSRSRSNPTSPGCRHRWPPSPTTSAPTYLDRLSVLRDQVFVLDHMYMSVFSTCGWLLRLGVTLALLVSIHPALVLLAVFALPTVLTSTWRPAVERVAAGARRAGGPAGAPSLHPGDHRRARQGSARHRDRRRDWSRSAARPGSAGTRPIASGALGLGRLAHARLGRLRQRLGRRGGLRLARASAPPPGDVLLVLAAGVAPLRVHRRHGRRDRLPARHLDGRLPAPRLAGGLRGLAGRDGGPARAGTLRAGIRLDHVSFAYPGTDAPRARGRDARAARRHGRRHRRRERRRQDHAGQAARQALRADRRARSWSTAQPLARMPADDVARAPGRAPSRTSSASSSSRARPSASATARGWTTSPRSSAPSSAPGRDDVVARLPVGLDTQLGPTWPGGVDVSFGQWQKLALARGFMRDHPLLLVLDEPTAALDAETEHALFERYAAAAHRGRHRRATAASRSSSRTASAPSAWPTSSSCSTARASSRSARTRSSWPEAGSTPSCTGFRRRRTGEGRPAAPRHSRPDPTRSGLREVSSS